MTDIGEKLFAGSSEMALIAAAHELKAPLALIRQLALGLESEAASVQSTRLAHKIALSSERALRLTSDLTRASRLQAGLFELEPINPIELCEDIARELQPLFDARGVNIRVRRSRNALLAVANRDLLRRVVANFSDNALEYVGDNNIVELTASGGRNGIRIGVRDYGPAVSPKILKGLKSSLGRTVQPLQARPSSSGLGLYLAGRFAEHMSGKIGTVNHRDGTTFYIDLPASRQLSLL